MTLDQYASFAPFYDLWSARMTEDIDFYVRLARASGGPVVELGAGTGRISIPIAEAGVPVIAVDASAAMIGRGRAHAEAAAVQDRITWVRARMQDHVQEPPVDLVIIPFRSFIHLMTIPEQLDALAAVHRSLVPGGQLALNLFVPDPFLMVERHGNRIPEGSAVDEQGRTCRLFGEVRYDIARQRMTLVATVEVLEDEEVVAETLESKLEARLIWPAEMQHLLERAGFEIEALYGWFDERPFDEESREMIWVARKP